MMSNPRRMRCAFTKAKCLEPSRILGRLQTCMDEWLLEVNCTTTVMIFRRQSMRSILGIATGLALLHCCCDLQGTLALSFSIGSTAGWSLASQGSSATPIHKQKVAVVGAGGTLGGLVFGYLQRAGSLFGTGLAAPRCWGATADTAVRLNQLLAKQFCLAFADESYVKLTDLSEVDAIRARLDECDALILGTTMSVRRRAVVGGTYDRTPNDKAWEIYWDEGSATSSSDDAAAEAKVRGQIVDNVLKAVAAQQQSSGHKVRHLVVVDRDGSIVPQLQQTGMPFTCLLCPHDLVNAKDYTFKKGIVADLTLRALSDSRDDQSVANPATPIYRQDLAALCVQVLQTLSWDTSRVLLVSSAASSSSPSSSSSAATAVKMSQSGKRVDQEWCVNSHVLDEKLQPFLEPTTESSA